MTTKYIVVSFEGFEMHTSFAKGTTGHGHLYDRRMLSAQVAASMLVNDIFFTGRTAEQTQEREPFFHITSVRGGVEEAEIGVWVRGFSSHGTCLISDKLGLRQARQANV